MEIFIRIVEQLISPKAELQNTPQMRIIIPRSDTVNLICGVIYSATVDPAQYSLVQIVKCMSIFTFVNKGYYFKK